MRDLPSWPSFTEQEAQAVSDVLLSNKVNYWTGSQGKSFEEEFAAWAETDYAIAVANGTLALELALRALGISTGDEVVVTSRTFIASASAIVNVGAKPVFADVDLSSQNITPKSIQAVLSNKTKAIICVHLAGWPCDMDAINQLAQKHKLFVIEDCAQAHGALYRGKPVGGLGDVAAWSFCQDKIMTTGGEGGMVTTNNKVLWDKMWSYKDHGKSYDTVFNKQHPPGFRWLHESIGSNWRMTEMQAAIGRIQLTRMTEWQQQRQANAQQLASCLAPFSFISVPQVPEHIQHAFYKFYAFVDKGQNSISRDQIIESLNAAGVPCMQGSCGEVYLEKAFDGLNVRPEQPLTNAKQLSDSAIMFMVHPTITTQDMQHVCKLVQDCLTSMSAEMLV
ncbi:DegT/DnrJ/EryC1/StrS aminotransferase family protein [Agarivorans aestuarii]|uniref:DegT/DnrJ/EryC1/StrS aminotransferase family protein n=1 Tax=Agarivorans aestuarii TaxID=1563703 RepID=A0ABU7G0H5_9ALTE|nr:DegT/DnrJ/EryC1/StrS aminotransferase family protein [Agarivorans aestuarii]MEE1672840.1 DegT/DnrJ/EryC1/StrS aminotransferase family protein [Agarivorans aestuarii]